MLKGTLYVPDVSLTVVSIGRIVKAGYTVWFAKNPCDFKRGEDDRIMGYIPAGANGCSEFGDVWHLSSHAQKQATHSRHFYHIDDFS